PISDHPSQPHRREASEFRMLLQLDRLSILHSFLKKGLSASILCQSKRPVTIDPISLTASSAFAFHVAGIMFSAKRKSRLPTSAKAPIIRKGVLRLSSRLSFLRCS